MAWITRRTIAALAASVCLLSLVGCQSRSTADTSRGTTATADSVAAREIEDAIAAYLAALERSDAAAAVDFWDPETRILAPGMDAQKQAVADGIRSLFNAGTRVHVLSRRTLELNVHGDTAYELAQAEEVLRPQGAARPDTLRNNIFVRWRRGSDGRWRFHRVLIGPQASPPAR